MQNISQYIFPDDEQSFLLYEIFGLKGLLSQEDDITDSLLTKAEDLAEQMASLVKKAEKKGVNFSQGQVSLPDEQKKIYQLLAQDRWFLLSTAPGESNMGGYGLPRIIQAAITDILMAPFPAPVLQHLHTSLVARFINHFADQQTKQLFLPKLYKGEWTGAICITESEAGSSLERISCRAAKGEGDYYHINGEKCFIAGGNHDLGQNIVYLVLAIAENDNPADANSSFFLVPKYLPSGWPDSTPENTKNQAADQFQNNHVNCLQVKSTLGLSTLPLCDLSFGETGHCSGQLLGAKGQGLAMLTSLLNEMRLLSGALSVSLSSAAFQTALEYAGGQVQGRSASKNNAIISYPNIRYLLTRMHTMVSGCRSLLYYSEYLLSMANGCQDKNLASRFMDLAELFIPLCKAYCSEAGIEVCQIAIQVCGARGYCRQLPLERYLRDIMAAPLYCGTNSAQAVTLLGKKIAAKNGELLLNFTKEIKAFINEYQTHPQLSDLVKELDKGCQSLLQVTTRLASAAATEHKSYAILNSTPYLKMFGLLTSTFLLVQQAVTANHKLEKIELPQSLDKMLFSGPNCWPGPKSRFYASRIHLARHACYHFIPQLHSLAVSIISGDSSSLDLPY